MIEIPDGCDPWDPNNWQASTHEHRIYADEGLEHYVVVDAWHYSYLSQWQWSMHSRKLWERTGRFYLRRLITTFTAPDGASYESPTSGYMVRHRNRETQTRFLHTEVLLRSGVAPETPEHTECDHKDRATWNCREANLRWATRKEQVANSSYLISLVKARAVRW